MLNLAFFVMSKRAGNQYLYTNKVFEVSQHAFKIAVENPFMEAIAGSIESILTVIVYLITCHMVSQVKKDLKKTPVPIYSCFIL